MSELVKVLRDGRIVVFGRITDKYGNSIKEAIVVLEGKKVINGRVYRNVYGICKTDQNGEYLFTISDKNVKYKVQVFEDRYHTVDDVVRFIRG